MSRIKANTKTLDSIKHIIASDDAVLEQLQNYFEKTTLQHYGEQLHTLNTSYTDIVSQMKDAKSQLDVATAQLEHAQYGYRSLPEYKNLNGELETTQQICKQMEREQMYLTTDYLNLLRDSPKFAEHFKNYDNASGFSKSLYSMFGYDKWQKTANSHIKYLAKKNETVATLKEQEAQLVKPLKDIEDQWAVDQAERVEECKLLIAQHKNAYTALQHKAAGMEHSKTTIEDTVRTHIVKKVSNLPDHLKTDFAKSLQSVKTTSPDHTLDNTMLFIALNSIDTNSQQVIRSIQSDIQQCVSQAIQSGEVSQQDYAHCMDVSSASSHTPSYHSSYEAPSSYSSDYSSPSSSYDHSSSNYDSSSSSSSFD